MRICVKSNSCRVVFFILLITAFEACRPSGNHTTGNEDCGTQRTISGLGIYLNNFTVDGTKGIRVKLSDSRDGRGKWEEIKFTDISNKTLRNQRYCFWEKEIGLSDTVYLRLPDGKIHAIHNFKYQLRPHASMGSVTYSCDFYELYVDNEIQTGGVASITSEK
ncbi:hypothetical protein [Chitinophaga arvensicola]|uniref:PLAT domain-containing protein n=1 Tax=Chitinophaga arvensicola TaxID=29529 RepID=A0A1I0RX14_9BACT|nr:hypothetical protein [Chitinophaga arvensicola]SEW45344.1 hypothetical protein SAMN04488122_3451 [Chitinophaga arvensicola]